MPKKPLLRKALLYAVLLGLALLYVHFFFDGMFFDGMTYSSTARNLAAGEGSLFDLHYTNEVGKHYRDSSPLFCWLQSAFFFMLGDHMWTERLCCLLLLFLSLWLLSKIADAVLPAGHKNVKYLLLVLFLVNPRLQWIYSNNMQETLLLPLVLLFALVVLRQNRIKTFLLIIAGALLMVAMLLTKGPNGFFVLALLPLYGWIRKCFWRQVMVGCGMFALAAAFIMLFYFSDNGFRHMADVFYHEQLVKSALGLRESSGSHFNFLNAYASDLLLLIILSPFLLWWRKKTLQKKSTDKWSLVLVTTGLVMPLMFMVSTKQNSYYFVVSYPFFYLAFVLFFLQSLKQVATYLEEKILSWKKSTVLAIQLVLLAAVVSVTVLLYGKPLRDADLIADVNEVQQVFEKTGYVPADESIIQHWALIAYLQRKHKMSMLPKSDRDTVYLSKNPAEGEEHRRLRTFLIIGQKKPSKESNKRENPEIRDSEKLN